jgi:hypothetical protein
MACGSYWRLALGDSASGEEAAKRAARLAALHDDQVRLPVDLHGPTLQLDCAVGWWI